MVLYQNLDPIASRTPYELHILNFKIWLKLSKYQGYRCIVSKIQIYNNSVGKWGYNPQNTEYQKISGVRIDLECYTDHEYIYFMGCPTTIWNFPWWRLKDWAIFAHSLLINNASGKYMRSLSDFHETLYFCLH